MQRLLVLPSASTAAAASRFVFFFFSGGIEGVNGVGPFLGVCYFTHIAPHLNPPTIESIESINTATTNSRGGGRWRLLRLRPALSTLSAESSSSRAAAASSTSSSSSSQRRRRPLLGLGAGPRAALGTKAGGGAPHPELFLAELFGGVVNKPREGTVGGGGCGWVA